jgi:hypothetical protein
MHAKIAAESRRFCKEDCIVHKSLYCMRQSLLDSVHKSPSEFRAGIFKQSMGTKDRVEIGSSIVPARQAT